jgi:NitT/TauT family transport system ATP-binding protein
MLTLENVSKRWPGEGGQEPVLALHDVTLTVDKGEFVTVIGPSGCGKSTLLEVVAGLVPATGGTVSIAGQEVHGPHPDIGVVFQQDATFPWLTAQKNVEFGLEFNGVPKKERAERARETLDLVGLGGFEDHYPDQLSGGMRQRVNIARVLASVPKLVLMDEPFGALDEQTRLVLGDELLSIWQRANATILFITHSLNEAATLSDRVVVMSSRPGGIKEIVDNPLPRPRSTEDIGTPEFTEMTGRLWHLLEHEAREVGAR